jgi:hypothetical protein
MVGRLIVEHDRLTTPNRETPTPESGPAGADVPSGTTGIVDRLRDGLIGDAWGETDIDASWGLMTEAADEIARLRGEVERLTRQVDHWIGYARATETHAARLEDRRADLAARAADLALKAQAVAKADRAALATRVAEAVREACKQAVIGTYGDARNHHRMDAIDLGPVVAAALKESAP